LEIFLGDPQTVQTVPGMQIIVDNIGDDILARKFLGPEPALG
jgi:hypothetical protein